MATGKQKAKGPIGQRSNNRFRVPSCQVDLSKVGGIIVKLFGKKEYKASLVNLSTTGLQIVTPDILNPDEEYNITLFVPGTLPTQEIKAKVVWSKFFRKELNQNRYYRVGFQFIDMPKDVEAKLKKLETKYA